MLNRMQENRTKVEKYLKMHQIKPFELKINQFLIIEDGQREQVDEVKQFLLFSLSTERVKLKLQLSSLYEIFDGKLGKVTIEDVLQHKKAREVPLTYVSIFLENQIQDDPHEFASSVASQFDNQINYMESYYNCEIQ